MPDLYLDELRLELQETCGVSVVTSTIWQTLQLGGYQMKKSILYAISDIMLHALVHMRQTSLYSWMRVWLIGGQHIGDGPGQYGA